MRKSRPLICQIDGCTNELPTDKRAYRRFRICPEHFTAPEIAAFGNERDPTRFCHRCSRRHPICEFVSVRRVCTNGLKALRDHREKLRRQSEAVEAAENDKEQPLASNSSPGGGGTTATSDGGTAATATATATGVASTSPARVVDVALANSYNVNSDNQSPRKTMQFAAEVQQRIPRTKSSNLLRDQVQTDIQSSLQTQAQAQPSLPSIPSALQPQPQLQQHQQAPVACNSRALAADAAAATVAATSAVAEAAAAEAAAAEAAVEAATAAAAQASVRAAVAAAAALEAAAAAADAAQARQQQRAFQLAQPLPLPLPNPRSPVTPMASLSISQPQQPQPRPLPTSMNQTTAMSLQPPPPPPPSSSSALNNVPRLQHAILLAQRDPNFIPSKLNVALRQSFLSHALFNVAPDRLSKEDLATLTPLIPTMAATALMRNEGINA